MAEYLAEQMRSLTRRLEELAHNPLPDTGLEGSLNPKQLAELLGVGDLQTFTRSMNKIRAGDADKLTRMEMTELAEAFVRLLAAEAEDTQKAMQALKRVSAREEPVIEAETPGGHLDSRGRLLVGSSDKLVAPNLYRIGGEAGKILQSMEHLGYKNPVGPIQKQIWDLIRAGKSIAGPQASNLRGNDQAFNYWGIMSKAWDSRNNP